MGVSLWLVAALVVIPAVQVPLVLYLSQYVAADESELPSLPSGYSTPPSEWGLDDRSPGSIDGTLCQRCGTVNEPGYRFCRECAALL